MNYPMLETFLAAAECRSFTKAAAKLYLSPTAVMKQINAMESETGVRLFDRKRSGVTLTAGGKILYDSAVFIRDYAEKSIAQAKDAMESESRTLCVGTSLLNPAKPFMDLWYQYNADFPDYRLHLVPFEDSHEGILSEIALLGEKFDFLIGVCDSRAWLSRCSFLQLGTYRKMVSVSREHPLAGRKLLQLSDLYGQTLMMVPEGDSGTNDFIRHDLQLNHPQIHIEDTPQRFYDLGVFNTCAETGKVLLTIECWQDVHPGLVTIPVAWDYRIPYGLLYSKNPSPDAARFVRAVREGLKKR